MQVQQQIHSLVTKFASDLEATLRGSILESVTGALGGVQAPRPAAPKHHFVAKPSGGAKRDPKVLAKLVEDLRAHVVKNPGQNIETIAKEMKVSSAELALPVVKLLATKRISKKGQKRATRYYPGTKK